MKRNVAVVGAGYWGKNLARNFEEINALHTICDSNELLEETYRSKYPQVQFSTSFADVLADESIQGVAIATPAVTHFNIVMAALKSRKHVFVEKPLALNEEEGKQLVEFAEKHNLALMVGHILQYHNAVIKLKELVDSGELGKIHYICSNRLSIGKIRTEENILWSFAPHDISVILMLLEEEPRSVYATGGEYLQHDVADVTLTTMDFPSGAKAHIFVSWLHPFKEQKLVVIGDKKMAVFDDVSQKKLVLYPHQINWYHRTPVASKAEAEVVEFEMQEPLKQECLHFLECVQTGAWPKTDGREGLKVLKVLQASQESLNKYTASEHKKNVFPKTGKEQKFPTGTEYFVHESSYVDENVSIGANTKIWHFSHVMSGSVIGNNCNIGQNVVIGPDVRIGDGCKIQNNVSIFKGVTLEDEVFCGPSMVFTNIHNPRAHIPRMHEVRKTLVKRGATLGANCTIVCGHTIGACAFVGAGAVVTMDVPDYTIVVGNPAKQIGWMCSCGNRLSFDEECGRCPVCGLEYRRSGKNIIKATE